MIQNNQQLRPNAVLPSPGESSAPFTMARFAPITDDFYFYHNDRLVILSPWDVLWEAPLVARSTKTLEEHIQYIQKNKIKKALVIAEDISFLRQCPSLECLHIIPPYSAATFDYSPLYDMPNLKQLDCQTVYGARDKLTAHIDYSRISGVQHLTVRGKRGHCNIEMLRGLKALYLSQGQPISKTLANFDLTAIEDLDLCQSPIASLEGLENSVCLKNLGLSHCRQLADISALAFVCDSLTMLDIEACGKLKDFSVLGKLHNLEHLRLYGSNNLPNLEFLREMPKLKTFTFSMNVVDGDLSLCMNLPYASCHNKKHYNLKDSDLPKNLKQRSGCYGDPV